MEEDKRIKTLLQQFGVEETSSTFSNSVMEKINAAVLIKETKPLLDNSIVNFLKIIFCLVVVMLSACILFIPFNNMPIIFSINISSNIYKQLFSFIIVFWIGMFINVWLNKIWNSKKVFFL